MTSFQDNGGASGTGAGTASGTGELKRSALALVSSNDGASAAPLTPDQQALALKYRQLVPSVVHDVQRSFRIPLDADDLCSLGHIGLVQAVQVHDPTGTPFPTYARYAIAWAIFDGLRKEGKYRYARTAIRKAAAQWLAHEHGTVDVMRATPEGSGNDLDSFVGRVAMAAALDMAARLPQAGGEEEIAERELAERSRAALREALDALNDFDRALVDAVYFRGMLLKEAAAEADLGAAAYRRHQRAVLQRLAALLRARGITHTPSPMDLPAAPRRADERPNR
jgi:RNA polymerase sigma factor for flagellar operon FliA